MNKIKRMAGDFSSSDSSRIILATRRKEDVAQLLEEEAAVSFYGRAFIWGRMTKLLA